VIGAPRRAPPARPRKDAAQAAVPLKSAAAAWGSEVRAAMQAVIDGEGGTRVLSRGVMPRLVKRSPSAA